MIRHATTLAPAPLPLRVPVVCPPLLGCSVLLSRFCLRPLQPLVPAFIAAVRMTTVTAPVDVKVSAASTASNLVDLRAILGEAAFWTSQKKGGIIPSSRKSPEDSGPNRFLHLCLRSLYPERVTLLSASFRPTSQLSALGGSATDVLSQTQRHRLRSIPWGVYIFFFLEKAGRMTGSSERPVNGDISYMQTLYFSQTRLWYFYLQHCTMGLHKVL